ncbi:MAG: tRNA (adenosine(37)-N6)-threonylcarbamoyltransferase complex dimerization subunit type 1 TsaB [Candidatus Dormibacteraeota bacterium]|nr:tRNA (adenosine(37)-N6)-threonylcarbamoyltransferase complex dimerization subunit type 1 TsaB [Candidatus Dormibacteraeota bacterium]
MTVLAIDTSSRGRCVVVVAAHDGTLLRADVRTEVAIDLVLPPALVALLDAEVDAVAVVTGPGSYTGVRTGIAAALGVAEGRRLPLHGIEATEVVAAGAVADGASRGRVVLDAGRGGIYVCAFDNGETTTAVRDTLDGFRADGTPVFSTDDLPITGLRRLDARTALARAVPVATARGAVPRDGLQPVYVE